jgi:hypothetical protein
VRSLSSRIRLAQANLDDDEIQVWAAIAEPDLSQALIRIRNGFVNF